MLMMCRALAVGLCALTLAARPTSADEGLVTVFAAASMTDALMAIDTAATGNGLSPLLFSFAGTSTLARQIEAGAPADIFISADMAWMDYMEGKGLIEPGTRRAPIGNTLVLISPMPGPAAPVTLADIPELLGADGRLAVANPAHVPAGRYAAAALAALGLWPVLEDRLARADNVRAALALVARGEAPAGIVYATDARVADVAVVARFPESSHPPIRYAFAIVRGQATPAVRAAFDFMTGHDGADIFARFGFQPIE